jgi:cytidine deaminase
VSTSVIRDDIDWEALQSAAHDVKTRAHAPYSRFRVGAALLCEDGSIVSGCNVENASYGLTLCAERNAIVAAVARGQTRFRAIAVVTDQAEAVTPCGACRQVLAEFVPAFEVRCYGTSGAEIRESTASLLPHAFGKSDLAR